jgi:RimJ/RimL family protein N-acetyltransferase
MGRGLDGYFLWYPWLAGCAVLKARALVAPARGAPRCELWPLGLEQFPVAIARGKHLFPFRTEQLSPAAPMVLGSQGPGRVGRRRFLHPRAAQRAARRRCGHLPCAAVTGETIDTERLRLERWDVDRHTPALVAMNADAEVMRFIGEGRPLTPSESARHSEMIAAHWERFGFGLWAVTPTGAPGVPAARDAPDDPTRAVVLGFAGLSHPLWLAGEEAMVEVGWRLRRDAWGQGFASEAGRAAVGLGFGELGLPTLVSYILPGNLRSQAVSRRLGMTVTRAVGHPRLDVALEVWELEAARRRCAVA